MYKVKFRLAALNRTDDFGQITERLIEVENPNLSNRFWTESDLVLGLDSRIIDKDRVSFLNFDE